MTARRGRPTLSPWLDGAVRPVRDGVYQRQQLNGVVVFAKWSGRRWRIGVVDDRNEAADITQASSVQRAWPWRGRASEAK